MNHPGGYVALVLHAHLPFVRHPEHVAFLEEDWLFEAVIECYIPLLDVFERLVRDGVPWRLTMSMTPTLTAMLTDPLLQERCVRHIEGLVELAHRETVRTRHEPAFNRLAHMYLQHFRFALRKFDYEYGRDLTAAFRRFQDSGHLEIIASAATHGYLPLMAPNQRAVRAQIDVGVEAHRRVFGRPPQGFWLPECGCSPPDDVWLARAGIRWFVCETHGLLHARPRPRYAVYAPVYCADSGVAAFGRDVETSKQVWSATEGYPGDYDYRDFYRDIGYDLDFEYVRPWLKADVRRHVGIKYYAITGQTADKRVYDPDAAREKAAVHAGNFMFNRERQIEYLRTRMDRPPLIVAPYDAELFGHWWYEGPQWLDFFIRKAAYDQRTFRLVTPSEYLDMFPRNQVVRPSMSSWGYNGYSEVWLNGANDWIYRHLHKAAERMAELADTHAPADAVGSVGASSGGSAGPSACASARASACASAGASTGVDALTRRALNQAARELLLAQSSDWAFIMKTGTMVEYAVKRTQDHLGRFARLYEQIRSGAVDEGWLAELEARDNLFPWLDYRVYAGETLYSRVNVGGVR